MPLVSEAAAAAADNSAPIGAVEPEENRAGCMSSNAMRGASRRTASQVRPASSAPRRIAEKGSTAVSATSSASAAAGAPMLPSPTNAPTASNTVTRLIVPAMP